MVLKIIYSDKDIIAVNKPAGISVHPDVHHVSGTLIQEVIKKFPDIKNVGDYSYRPGVVHRLDKDTSGVMIMARNNESFEYLKKQFKQREIIKTYLTLVRGVIKKNGKIELSIGRSSHDRKKRIAIGKMSGKILEALTEYKILEKFNLGEDRFTLLEASPKTGRTHQIRSHFSAIGHPVICDKLYSGKNYSCPFGLKRHFLHARTIEFHHINGTRMRLEAGVPSDLKAVLKELRVLNNSVNIH